MQEEINRQIGMSGNPLGASWAASIIEPMQTLKILDSGNENSASLEWKKRYESLVQNSGEILYDWKAKANHVAYAGALKDLLGYEEKEIGASLSQWIERIHPEDRPNFYKNLRQCSKKKYVFDSIIRVQHKDGNFVHLRDRGQFYYGRDGQLEGMLGFLRDITQDIKKQEEYEWILGQLRESKQATQALIDSLVSFVGIVTIDGVVTDVNEVALQASGTTRNEVIGLLLWETPWWNISKTVQVRIKSAISAAALGTSERFDVQYKTIKGEIRWVDLCIQPLTDSDGVVFKIVCSCIDITERVRQRFELEREAGMFKQLAEFVPQHIWVSDAEGKRIYSNKGWHEFLGFEDGENEDDPKNWERITHPDDYPLLVKKWTNCLQSGKDYESQFRFLYRDGQYRWLLTRARAIRDENGKILKWIGCGTDIHEQKIAEMKLQQNSQQLEEMVHYQSINLAEANKEIESFSYSVSHDLKAPLRSIEGFSQYLLQEEGGNLSDQGKKDLERVLQSSQLLSHLIDDLLRLSRISRQEMYPTQIEIGAVVKKIWNRLETQRPLKNIQLLVKQMPPVKCDACLVEIALSQLLQNSLKFTSKVEQPTIEVGCELVDGNPVFYISDNGCGFNMAYREKLFGIFQRLHHTREFPGSGIGLATVRRIIHRHGGRIWANAEVNKGATFYFTFGNGTN